MTPIRKLKSVEQNVAEHAPTLKRVKNSPSPPRMKHSGLNIQ